MKSCLSVRGLLIATIATTLLPVTGHACGNYLRYDSELREQLRDPTWDLGNTATRLREMGPVAVDQLTAMRREVEQHDAELIPALDRLIDRVAAQRHAAHSGLYWYTDLSEAQAVAAERGKPILSLRLLGRLDEEFSCANSRFFRTTLYADPEISRRLRDQFVLHWESVRPVPRVTVDFGNGRTLQRTVTGNSIHYVVNHAGQILEALPGLYAPAEFTSWLERSAALGRRVAAAPTEEEARRVVVDYHQARQRVIVDRWNADWVLFDARKADGGRQTSVPLSPDELIARTDETMFELFAAVHQPKTVLDPAAVQLIRSENPDGGAAMALSPSKMLAEDPIFRLVRNLERTMMVDTIRNEYLLHRQLHEWFAESAIRAGNPQDLAADVERFNERVYADLFRSPLHDPWLGLLPASTYTALEGAGVTEDQISAAAVPARIGAASDAH